MEDYKSTFWRSLASCSIEYRSFIMLCWTLWAIEASLATFSAIFLMKLLRNTDLASIIVLIKPRGTRPQFRSEQDQTEDPMMERRRLLAEIENQKQMILKMDDKMNLYQKQYKKMGESNQRNIKRLIRHRNRFQELVNHRNEPEYFLHICGFMNEYMQEFMLTHDVHIMSMNEGPNPDNMSYEQLLELGENIGKVSKGITKEDFEKLPRRKNITSDHNCPICCTEFSATETAVALRCKHLYHEQCIMEWLKDENTCPICKKHVLDI